jgi:hypothetical protein
MTLPAAGLGEHNRAIGSPLSPAFSYTDERSRTSRHALIAAILTALFVALGAVAEAAEWFVAPAGSGAGTATNPFARIQDGLNAAQPGDVITVLPGTYAERLTTVRSGRSDARVTLRTLEGRGSVVVTMSGRVLTILHAHVTVDGFVFDGQYGLDDVIRVATSGSFFHFANGEVRRSTRDLIDLGAPEGVVIEHALVHHALNAADGRTDAHGIVAGAVRNLAIRDTEIHTFSGDGVQVDPGRAAPGWNHVTIERTRIWLAPLSTAENGFEAGVVPGENAIDTKANPRFGRAHIVLRDLAAWGFRGGLITNMAAFNLKEHIDAVVDRVTVFDSEIAFRLRGAPSGGAWVAVKNAVVYDTATAFRYENDIENLRVWNVTVGGGVARVFQAASSSSAGLDVRNTLIRGPLPREALARSNLSVDAAAFTDAPAHDYSLVAGSPAIDAGEVIPDVVTDITGAPRPSGRQYDSGAFEYPSSTGAAVKPPR